MKTIYRSVVNDMDTVIRRAKADGVIVERFVLTSAEITLFMKEENISLTSELRHHLTYKGIPIVQGAASS
jgi:hypothetical protein